MYGAQDNELAKINLMSWGANSHNYFYLILLMRNHGSDGTSRYIVTNLYLMGVAYLQCSSALEGARTQHVSIWHITLHRDQPIFDGSGFPPVL
jgi:hypothetical protein